MADRDSQKRFRVYFEEHTRTELIVHATSPDEAKAYCEETFRASKNRLPDQFNVRTDASGWKVENLSDGKE
jgi:hypothetical protein